MSDTFQDDLPFPDVPDGEGMFDAQLSLPLPAMPWAAPVSEIVKRDGRHEPFDKGKIAAAISRAINASGSQDDEMAESIAAAVAIYLGKRLNGQPPTVDQVSDAVERVLIQMSHADAALAYARYRDRRARIRRLRKGDMRALLSELEEARHEREAATAMDPSLRVRTSQDSIVQWDRNRIVEALQLETGLDTALATLIAVEVEKQIQEAGISVLTTPLVREMMGAKLIEHGLLEESERRRRLGVPLYDAARIIRGATPETVGGDPRKTDEALARAVKKEYALSEVFSQQVTQAHLSGDIHLQSLPFVDRLHSGEHALAWLATHGIRLPGGDSFANPPNHPETLLAQMVKYSDMLDALFSDTVGWHAFNYMAAPFVAPLRDRELRHFSEMLLYEYTYRLATTTGMPSPMQVSLYWNAPPDIAPAEAVGPGGEKDGRKYKNHELTARRLAWMMLDAFQRGGVNDANFPAPVIDVVLDKAVFQSFEGEEYLRHAAATALRRPGVRFVLASEDDDAGTAAQQPVWRPRNVVWHRVALNLPRAAVSNENHEQFFGALEQLCRLAVDAHTQKRDFIELLLDPVGNAPLAALALEADGNPYISSADGLFAVDVDGLFECAQVMCGTNIGARHERMRFMQEVLQRLRATLAQLAEQAGLRCILSANSDSATSRRFATLDASLFPRLVEQIIRIEPLTSAMTYLPGVNMPEEDGVSPLEHARAEGDLHRLLRERQFSRITLPIRNTSETALADLLKMLLRETDCAGVAFTVLK